MPNRAAFGDPGKQKTGLSLIDSCSGPGKHSPGPNLSQAAPAEYLSKSRKRLFKERLNGF